MFQEAVASACTTSMTETTTRAVIRATWIVCRFIPTPFKHLAAFPIRICVFVLASSYALGIHSASLDPRHNFMELFAINKVFISDWMTWLMHRPPHFPKIWSKETSALIVSMVAEYTFCSWDKMLGGAPCRSCQTFSWLSGPQVGAIVAV